MAKKVRYSDPGTGTQYSTYSKRIINKNGSFNVRKVGLGPSTRNAYQFLIQIGWWPFLGVIVIYLLAVNALFGLCYYAIGTENFLGITTDQPGAAFLECFYFSFQTFTTVGYGAVSPIGHAANGVAAFEAIFGWLSFAIITGILYGRFSRPSARVQYSKNALIAPYRDKGNSLQFRVANMRNSNLMEMSVTVMLMMIERGPEGILKRTFTPLHLERSEVLFFPLNWTIVHPITEESPIFNASQEDLITMDAEILIMLKGFDDTFSQTVHSRYSYKANEIIWGAKFKPMFDTQMNGDIHLFFDVIDEYEEVELKA